MLIYRQNLEDFKNSNVGLFWILKRSNLSDIQATSKQDPMAIRAQPRRSTPARIRVLELMRMRLLIQRLDLQQIRIQEERHRVNRRLGSLQRSLRIPQEALDVITTRLDFSD